MMGKSGDLLRKKKMEETRYTFTRQQLEDHDRKVQEAFRERVVTDANRKLEKKLADMENELGAMILRYMFPMVVKIMVAKFGWKPASKIVYDRKNRLTQLSEALVEEFERMFNGEIPDVEKYEREVYELTGCKLTIVED